MYKSAIVLTFTFALSSIASSLIAGDISTLTCITSIWMTTIATEAALWIGE